MAVLLMEAVCQRSAEPTPADITAAGMVKVDMTLQRAAHPGIVLPALTPAVSTEDLMAALTPVGSTVVLMMAVSTAAEMTAAEMSNPSACR